MMPKSMARSGFSHKPAAPPAGNWSSGSNLAAYDASMSGRWLMEEASGTRYDALGHNNLQPSTGVSQVAGYHNYGAGIAASRSLSKNNAAGLPYFLPTNAKLTLSTWIKWTSLIDPEWIGYPESIFILYNGDRDYQILSGYYLDNGDSTWQMGFSVTQSNMGGRNVETTWATPTVGAWHHFGYRLDGAGEVAMFIDGTKYTTSYNNTMYAATDEMHTLYFGPWYGGFSAFVIDETYCWTDTALSDAAMADLAGGAVWIG